MFRYDKSVAKLRAGGCEDEDILQLMDLFSEKIEEVAKAFMDLALPKSQVTTSTGKRDIGRSPGRSQGKEVEEQVLRMSDLTQFINKVEDVADSELETLRTYILKNTSERSQTLDLASFYDHVYLWAEGVWHERNGTVVEDTQNEEESILPDSPAKKQRALLDHQKEVSYTV